MKPFLDFELPSLGGGGRSSSVTVASHVLSSALGSPLRVVALTREYVWSLVTTDCKLEIDSFNMADFSLPEGMPLALEKQAAGSIIEVMAGSLKANGLRVVTTQMMGFCLTLTSEVQP